MCAALPSSGLVFAACLERFLAATVGRCRPSAAAEREGLGVTTTACASAEGPDRLHGQQPGCCAQASAPDLPLAGSLAFYTCIVAFHPVAAARLQESDGPKRPLSSYMLFAKVRAGIEILGACDCADARRQIALTISGRMVVCPQFVDGLHGVVGSTAL